MFQSVTLWLTLTWSVMKTLSHCNGKSCTFIIHLHEYSFVHVHLNKMSLFSGLKTIRAWKHPRAALAKNGHTVKNLLQCDHIEKSRLSKRLTLKKPCKHVWERPIDCYIITINIHTLQHWTKSCAQHVSCNVMLPWGRKRLFGDSQTLMETGQKGLSHLPKRYSTSIHLLGS